VGRPRSLHCHRGTSPKPKPRAHRIRRLLLRGAIAVLALTSALIAAGAVYVATLPGVGDGEKRVERILAARGGTDSGMPPPAKLADAVVAVEDEHFYSGWLINVLDGVGRAALATLQARQDPGGSTIAQQLAKQLYGSGSGLISTLREIGLGVKLSLHYSKARILEMYLNAVYYGHGYWGVAAAARGYFDTTPHTLDWAQAAMLCWAKLRSGMVAQFKAGIGGCGTKEEVTPGRCPERAVERLAMKGGAGSGSAWVGRRALRPLRFRFDRSPRCCRGSRDAPVCGRCSGERCDPLARSGRGPGGLCPSGLGRWAGGGPELRGAAAGRDLGGGDAAGGV
jgi:hypothetical protein